MKKTSEIFGSYALKFLPLHPLLKMKAARVDILLKETVPGSSSFFFLPLSLVSSLPMTDEPAWTIEHLS